MYFILVSIIIGAVISATSGAQAVNTNEVICDICHTVVKDFPAKLSNPHNQETTECKVCEFLVKTLDYLQKGNKSEAAVNSTIYRLCDLPPVSEKALCEMMAPLLVKQMEKGFNPRKACTAIQACKDGSNQPHRDFSALAIEGENGHAANSLKDHVENQADTSSGLVLFLDGRSGSKQCDICKDLVKFLVSVLRNNEEKLKNYIKDLCNRLPNPTCDKCNDFADNKLLVLLHDLIEKFLSPENVCTFLKMCPKDKLYFYKH